MKKLLLPVLFSIGTLTTFAQTSALIALENGKLDKAKEAIEKDIADPKSVIKPRVWLVRAQIYEGMATDPTGLYSKLDSMSAFTAYESYKKAIELDTKDGKVGKVGKEAQTALTKDPASKDNPRVYYGLLNQCNQKYQNKNAKRSCSQFNK